MAILIGEAVEVTYAGQRIRGKAIAITPQTVEVEAPFGVRAFDRDDVIGLRFMYPAPRPR